MAALRGTDGGVEGGAVLLVVADGDDPCFSDDRSGALKDGGVAADFDAVLGIRLGWGACEEGGELQGDDRDGRHAGEWGRFLVA